MGDLFDLFVFKGVHVILFVIFSQRKPFRRKKYASIFKGKEGGREASSFCFTVCLIPMTFCIFLLQVCNGKGVFFHLGSVLVGWRSPLLRPHFEVSLVRQINLDSSRILKTL
jgi:hypothetical protein